MLPAAPGTRQGEKHRRWATRGAHHRRHFVRPNESARFRLESPRLPCYAIRIGSAGTVDDDFGRLRRAEKVCSVHLCPAGRACTGGTEYTHLRHFTSQFELRSFAHSAAGLRHQAKKTAFFHILFRVGCDADSRFARSGRYVSCSTRNEDNHAPVCEPSQTEDGEGPEQISSQQVSRNGPRTTPVESGSGAISSSECERYS